MTVIVPRVQRGRPMLASDFNALAYAVSEQQRGGRSPMDVRILRCMVESVDTEFEIVRADEAVYDIRLIELNTVQYEVTWESRYIPTVYEPQHLVRIPAIGSLGIAFLFGEGQYRQAKYVLFDEHPSRTPCAPA